MERRKHKDSTGLPISLLYIYSKIFSCMGRKIDYIARMRSRPKILPTRPRPDLEVK